MVWTQTFLRDIRRVVPEFRYSGVDVVAHVVAANKVKFADDPLTEMSVGDMTSDPVPPGFDMAGPGGGGTRVEGWRESDRRFRVYEEAPGFRPGPRRGTRGNTASASTSACPTKRPVCTWCTHGVRRRQCV